MRLVLNLLSAVGLRPENFPPSSPLAPIGRLLEFVYAGLRRFDHQLFNQAPVATSQPISEEEAEEFGTDPTTGVVTGRVAYDPDDELEFNLVQAPEHGTVEFNPDGTYTYTPFYDEAHPANATTSLAAAAFTPETDTFVVEVSEVNPNHLHLAGGEHTTIATVNLDVAPNLTVTETVATGPDPGQAAVTPDGTRIYIPIGHTNEILVLNTADNSEVATILVDDEPERVTMSPDGKRAYVLHFGDTVTVIDTDPGTTETPNPAYNTVVTTINLDTDPSPGSGSPGSSNIAVSADGKYVYVTNNFTDDISVIDTSSNGLLTPIKLSDGAGGFEGNFTNIVVNPDEGRQLMYIGDASDSEILVVDTNPTLANGTPNPNYNTVIDRIPVTAVGTPQAMAVSEDGNRLFVAENGGTLRVIDTTPGSVHYNEVIQTVDIGNIGVFQNESIAIHGNRLYLTNIETDTVIPVEYDAAANEFTVLDPIPVGSVPLFVAITPDGTRLYAMNIGPEVGDYPTNVVDDVSVISILVPEDV